MSTRTLRRLACLLLVAGLAAGLSLPGCGGGGGNGSSSDGLEYTISGALTGSVINDVPIELRGDATYDTATDDNGTFLFPTIAPGTYSVTPVLQDVSFSPPNRIVQITNADVGGVNFVSTGERPPVDGDPPASPVRLVFVQHSDGSNWLDTGDGDLGDTLGANNYFVSDISYGWDALPLPDNTDIGSRIDIGHWYTWFSDTTPQSNLVPTRDNITSALYLADVDFATYDRTLVPDPGGENDIIVIMSPYPNSDVKIDDVAQPPENLHGEISSHPAHTVTNCKLIYDGILEYFKTRPDKLFVVVTPPPRSSDDPAALLTNAGNARWLANYLVNDWLRLADWAEKNVAVFDFFNVLTDEGNHHRLYNQAIQHLTVNGSSNYTAPAYQSGGGDSHPNDDGNRKGTREFVPLLNVYYQQWQRFLNP